MMSRVLLLLVAGFVFSFATPSYATFWNGQGRSRGIERAGQNEGRDCDRTRQRDRDCEEWAWLSRDNEREGRRDRDRNRDREPREECDDDRDWCKDIVLPRWNCDDDRDRDECRPRKPRERCENPVPEPATAGLSMMGLGALAAAVRRRRK